MWVRSQDKKMLVQVDCFMVSVRTILGFQGPDDGEGVILGTYESHERGVNVLNMIQNNCKCGFATANMPQN